MHPASLSQAVEQLGPWFHNLRIGEDEGVQTAPDHPLGDFPSNFWQFFAHSIPVDLRGKTVLDIGCNGGFYSFEMKRRGAARVLGIDSEPLYLTQARFARDRLGWDVEFEQLDVYDVDRLGEQFDLVLFLGVFYHLRHPLYALEKVAGLVREQLLFQTMERGAGEAMEVASDYPFGETDVFFDQRFPRMYFIEQRFAGDQSNWWIPNASATRAMLQSTGLRIVGRPCREVYLCEPSR
jgi:tRNA (mo5U34)-methyltransferase